MRKPTSAASAIASIAATTPQKKPNTTPAATGNTQAGKSNRSATAYAARDKKRRQHAIKEHRARGVATWEAERGQDEQRIVEARPQPLVRRLEDHVHQHAAADRDGEREQPVPLLQSREHDAECGAGSAD